MPLTIELQDCFSLVIGRRGSGKSVLLKWLIRQSRNLFSEVFIFSPSSFSGYWSDVLDESNIFLEYDETWVQKLVDKMTGLNKGKNQQSPDFKRVMLVLDDVISSDAKSQTISSRRSTTT